MLHRAAHAGDAAAVAELLDAGGEADAATRHGVTPLALASAGGHDAVIEDAARGRGGREPGVAGG